MTDRTMKERLYDVAEGAAITFLSLVITVMGVAIVVGVGLLMRQIGGCS